MAIIVKKVLPTFFLVCLVLTAIWTAFGVHDNFNVQTGKVTFEWVDGQYIVTRDPDGYQFRPLTSLAAFVDTLGESSTSLVRYMLEVGGTVMDGFNRDDVAFPAMDGTMYQNVIAFFEWLPKMLGVILDVLLFIISIPVYAIAWIWTAIFNVLGFLVTGKSFLNEQALLEWLQTHPIGL